MKVIRLLAFKYVSSAKITEIKNMYIEEGFWGRVKGDLKAGTYLMSEGYREAKKDCKFYLQTRSERSNKQVLKSRYSIKKDLYKLPVIALLFCIPGGIPLILAYMALFPALIPSWFTTDKLYEKELKENKENQIKALQYFLQSGSITVDADRKYETSLSMCVFRQMSLEQQKKVCELCYGYAADGTIIIYKSLKIKLQYLISPAFSKWLMLTDLQAKLDCEDEAGDETDKLKAKVLSTVPNLLSESKIKQ